MGKVILDGYPSCPSDGHARKIATSNNPEEAEKIVDEITVHLRKAKKTFTLGDVEYKNAEKFAEEHEGCNSKSAMGEKFAYHFIPGSIGTNAYIECLICGKKVNITNYDRW